MLAIQTRLNPERETHGIAAAPPSFEILLASEPKRRGGHLRILNPRFALPKLLEILLLCDPPALRVGYSMDLRSWHSPSLLQVRALLPTTQ